MTKLWIDQKYITKVAPFLEGFRRKSKNLYNFRCPICGDSKKNKRKARGYLYYHGKSDSIKYKCHNCNYGSNMGSFIEKISPDLYREYRFESYKEGENEKKSLDFFNENEAPTKPAKPNFIRKKLKLELLTNLSDNHPVVKYAKSRNIPPAAYSELLCIPDTQLLEEVDPKYEGRLKDNDPRLVFECKTEDNDVIGYVARAISNRDKLRYITVRLESSDDSLIYGLDKINMDDRILIVEGPLDSLYLPNCIAAGTSNLLRVNPYIKKNHHRVYIFDNQPRNKDIVKQMKKTAAEGYSVVIWPQNVHEKDIGEMIENQWTRAQIIDMINTRIFEGTAFDLEMTQWSKY